MRAIAQSGPCPITRTPLSLLQLAPYLLAPSMVDYLRMYCTYGCVLGKHGTYELDPHGCPTVVIFWLRKTHRKACKFGKAEPVIWSLAVFGALQTQYFWLLLRRTAWIAIPLTGFPAVALVAYMAVERV